ncbi:MAG: apolipoprotein N-acyltransferase, partial [Verrucomicrobiota bacterium]
PLPEGVTELRALIVQGNIPQGQKWDPDKVHENYRVYDDLTRLNMESAEFDLVIWPESALYFPLYDGMYFHKEVMNPLLAMQDVCLITGVNEDALDEGDFNAMAIHHGEVENFEVYRKVHLVPFGEFIPGRDWFPPARWLAERVMRLEFDAGQKTEPLPLANSEVEVIPMICFEDTVGRLTRKFVREGPQLMVNVTNDGWFGETEAAAQHLANAKFRCIELRRPMVRSTNNGVSAVVDEIGSLFHRGAEAVAGERVIADPKTGATFIRGFMADTIAVPNAPRSTVYAKVGDSFSVGCLVVTMVSLLTGWGRDRRWAK